MLQGYTATRLRLASILAIALSLMLVHVSSAQSYTQTCVITNSITTPENCIVSAFPYMALAILVSFMIIAIVYMAGEVLNYAPLKNWYKIELWEAAKTMLVAISIICALIIVSGIAAAYAGKPAAAPGSGNNPLSTNLANLYSVAHDTYLSQQLDTAYTSYSAVVGLSLGVDLLKSIELSFWLPVPIPVSIVPPVIIGALQSGSKENLFKSNFISSYDSGPLGTYSFTSTIMKSVVTPTLLVFQIQYDLFYYIVAIGLGVLIPIGMVLRAFPVVRNIGGTMIAMGIGISVVYPSLLVVLNLPVSNYLPNLSAQSAGSPLSCPFNSALVCRGWGSAMSLIISTTGVGNAGRIPVGLSFGWTEALQNSNAITKADQGFAVGLITPLTKGIYPSLNFVVDSTLLSILQFILFAIDLLIGWIITESIAGMLGGRVRLGIGSKLRIK